MGKSCVFLACFLNGNDQNGESYFERYKKFLKFYRGPIKKEIGFSDFVLVDNASDVNKLKDLGGSIYGEDDQLLMQGSPDLNILRYEAHYKRGPIGHDYPYGWRMVFAARRILSQYEKVIFIDSDGFVLSRKLAHWIRDIRTGWRALWCERHHFPEGNLHVLTEDAYPLFKEFTEGDFMRHNGKCMELTLPFTHIDKGFVAERFGEEGTKQRADMDFYAQCWLKTNMEFKE